MLRDLLKRSVPRIEWLRLAQRVKAYSDYPNYRGAEARVAKEISEGMCSRHNTRGWARDRMS